MADLLQARQYLNQLDLEYIIDYMCSENYPMPRWTYADAEHCCQLYKNFLYLIKKHWPEPLVPSREIDEFWHNHILNTKKYYHDCLQIFGHYLHHDPASPQDNPKILLTNYLKTKNFYQEEFGKPLDLLKK